MGGGAENWLTKKMETGPCCCCCWWANMGPLRAVTIEEGSREGETALTKARTGVRSRFKSGQIEILGANTAGVFSDPCRHPAGDVAGGPCRRGSGRVLERGRKRG